jgi:hypothetical protein
MRILETCMAAWPMPEMQKQVDSVREAFSADVRKPFMLKPSFPYGSPQSATHPSPPLQLSSSSSSGTQHANRPSLPGSLGRDGSMDHHHAHHHIDTRSYPGGHHPMTPPISAGPVENAKSGSPSLQTSLALMATTGAQASQPPSSMPLSATETPSTWNPSRIFEYVYTPLLSLLFFS